MYHQLLAQRLVKNMNKVLSIMLEGQLTKPRRHMAIERNDILLIMKPQTFIFIGRSGCGKGTQAKLLDEQ
jgi:ABC-type oligopeptide transport system ATPase subunit